MYSEYTNLVFVYLYIQKTKQEFILIANEAVVVSGTIKLLVEYIQSAKKKERKYSNNFCTDKARDVERESTYSETTMCSY